MGLLEALGWVVAVLVAANPPEAQLSSAPDVDGAGLPALMREELKSTGQFRQPRALGEEGPSIRPATTPSRPERAAPVPPAADALGTPVATAASGADLGWRADQLRACPAEAAAARRMREGNVSAGSVLLRWTVLADGGVRDTEVVALREVALRESDPALLDCIERKMSSWTFARQPGNEPVHLEHRLNLAAERSNQPRS
jgi:hypothetical protein